MPTDASHKLIPMTTFVMNIILTKDMPIFKY
jgi:hypothetical protein